MPRIPEIPGNVVPRHSEQEIWLKRYVASLCGLDHDRFPGSQPVSFASKHIERLERQDFWVCEKSDGIRVLFFLQTDPPSGTQVVYLIDRHNSYRELPGFWFPSHEKPKEPLLDTIIDGELVIDVDPRNGQETLRYLAFDCLVVNGQSIMDKTLDKRYGRLRDWFYRPHARMIKELPHMAASQPFEIKVKDISFSYGIEEVFQVVIPALHHGNDGLIYTCVETLYTPGTDENILKWKPPSENSIDFKLVLRFPPSKRNPSQPDFHPKPFFGLHIYCGDERGKPKYEPYDELHVSDAEWEKMKLSGEQFDDRIVEVHWDPSLSHWRLMRFRDDKPNGNFKGVVENIISSIADGVEKDALLARSSSIRTAWKARLANKPHTAPTAQGSSQAPAPLAPPGHPPPNGGRVARTLPPNVPLRYGPIAVSRWSKASGPTTFAGMFR
ncbi:mRNA capping enzyme [Hygrophoropsis aurantiaca]|uniref:mRNA capping enzyme n=1 Tax=Hygrophoropsis aurantiaca TaxID=72124 RepID=A0ACB7ZZ82_9AGAM|nr:mRNA capping enzyme [Hygrophoropsis aurantiaca]